MESAEDPFLAQCDADSQIATLERVSGGVTAVGRQKVSANVSILKHQLSSEGRD
jgi:hypothetical protein